jgi:hypothetical protein
MDLRPLHIVAIGQPAESNPDWAKDPPLTGA